MAEPRTGRRTFGPVVLTGIVGAGLAAIAGSKDWFAPTGATPGSFTSLHGVSAQGAEASARAIQQGLQQSYDAPAVTALALVALAAWGVVLVTRRWVRRCVAVLAALASAGAMISAVVTLGQPPHDAHLSGAWPWLALVGALLSLLAAGAAVLLAPTWPEMGRRYDAPTGAARPGPATPQDLAEADNIDLWKSITEGRDPTADGDE